MSESPEQTVVRAQMIVKGRVQGVGYRAFAARVASTMDLQGGVRNRDDGRVELDVEGAKSLILMLIDELRKGPPAARVTAVEVEWGKATGRFSDFQVWY
jgi:acylphosphatase